MADRREDGGEMTRDEFISKWSHSSPGQLEFNLCARDLDALIAEARREALEEAAGVARKRELMVREHGRSLPQGPERDSALNCAAEASVIEFDILDLGPRATAEATEKCAECGGTGNSVFVERTEVNCPSCSGTGRAKGE